MTGDASPRRSRRAPAQGDASVQGRTSAQGDGTLVQSRTPAQGRAAVQGSTPPKERASAAKKRRPASRPETERAPAGLPTRAQFARLRAEYAAKWGVSLAVADAEGTLILGKGPEGCVEAERRRLFKRQMQEALRWGEAPFDLLPDGTMVWTAPLMQNLKLTGGVAAHASRRRLFPDGGDDVPAADVRKAAVELRLWLEEENLTNAPFLEMRRDQYMSERRRAEAIHAFKAYAPDFRSVYIREEPALMQAIRKGDRDEARGRLNGILVALHHQAGENLSLIKSFFLEMVTLMCRTAVEAGCDARELLGKNYEAFTALSAITAHDDLGPWLHTMLERLLDTIPRYHNRSPATLLQAAMTFMRENLHQDVSRDRAARAAHMSPAHFSRLFKKEMRESFTDMLNRMRVDQAAELLARTDQSLCMIALDCGFKDQSYFTKVFRKYMRNTPREYRLRLQTPIPPRLQTE